MEIYDVPGSSGTLWHMHRQWIPGPLLPQEGRLVHRVLTHVVHQYILISTNQNLVGPTPSRIKYADMCLVICIFNIWHWSSIFGIGRYVSN